MKKNFFLISAILTIGFAVSAFIAGCSSDSDEPTYENDTQRVEAMKAKVLKLAEMYGLDVIINDEFNARYKNGSLDFDSLETEFSKMSQIRGHFTYVEIDGNELHFSTGKNKMLRNKNLTVTPREYQRYEDSFIGKYRETHKDTTYNISYTIIWWYDDFSHECSVKIKDESLEVDVPTYKIEARDFSYQFLGTAPNFIYSFYALLTNKTASSISFRFYIQGTNSDTRTLQSTKLNDSTNVYSKSITRNYGYGEVTIR